MKDLLVRLVIVIIAGAVVAGVLSGLAGRWDLWNVWAAVGIFVVLGSLQTLALHRKNPVCLRNKCSRPVASYGAAGRCILAST